MLAWNYGVMVGRKFVVLFFVASLFFVAGGRWRVDSLNGTSCVARTPRPFNSSTDTRVPPSGGSTQARTGPSWTGSPGAHAGAQSGPAYAFGDASTGGLLLVFGFPMNAAHLGAGPAYGTATACVQSS